MCAGIEFGAACTLSHMAAVLRQAVRTLPPHQTEVFLAILEQLQWFAGQQIRNVAVSLDSSNLKLIAAFVSILKLAQLYEQMSEFILARRRHSYHHIRQ